MNCTGITLLVITVVMFYPIRLYAPDAKALFIPLIYSVGVFLGGILMWIPSGFFYIHQITEYSSNKLMSNTKIQSNVCSNLSIHRKTVT